MNRRICSLILPLLLACGGSKEKPAAPATVENATTETALTTITLTPDAVRRLGIQTARVESLTVLPTRTVGGEIVVPPGLSVTVAAPMAGTVLPPSSGVTPTAGARVRRGAQLLRLAALPPDIGQAERNYQVAAAHLRQAQAEAERTARLFAERLVSARENERAQDDLATARATASAAAGQLRLVRGGGAAGSGVSVLVVSAPTDGVVRVLNAAPGQIVAPGTALAEIMRTDRLWVRVPVYAGDVTNVRRNAPAIVHGLGGPQSGPATTAVPISAPPSADASAASVDLFYELRGTVPLRRPGERVGVTLPLTGLGERGLTIPLDALVRDMSGGSWVYERADSITFVRRRVEVARVSGPVAVLSLGPKPGTPIVTAGSAELFGVEFGAGK